MTRTRAAARSTSAAGDWLRSALEQANHTTGTLAVAIGVHQTSVSNYLTGKNAVPEERIAALADALRMHVIDVRRGLGLWVPEGMEPRMVTPEEAIRADPTLNGDQRQMAIEMLALIRKRSTRPTPPAEPGHYDPDAPPWRPGE